MNRRGAYFFVIDAVIGGVILISTLMFIFSTYSITPNQDPSVRAAEDLITFFSSTRIREYDSELVRNMTIDGNITNLDNTIADQVIEFYYDISKRPQLYNFTQDIATGIISKDRGLVIALNKTVIYNSTFHKPVSTMNSSKLMVVSKIMNFKIVNETTIYGPVWLEVKVWV